MHKTNTVLIIIGTALISTAGCEVLESNLSENVVRQPKFGFLTGTSNMISTLANDLLTRSTTSSQVLSLNLTNLVILFVLKAIIFGASNFGFGYGGHGRSVDQFVSNNSSNEVQPKGFLSEQEMLFILNYLQADSTNNYDCLQWVVCEDPSKAKEYLLAGKIFLKGAEFFGSNFNDSKYEKILTLLQEAVSNGINRQDCSEKYQCSLKNR